MNNRRYQRIEVPDLVADVSDGVSCFSGTVRNISRVGLQLDDLPKRLNAQVKMLSTSVYGNVNTREHVDRQTQTDNQMIQNQQFCNFGDLDQCQKIRCRLNSTDLQLLIIPKWVSENDFKKQIGFQIIEPSRAWTDLISRYEQKDDDGICCDH